MSAPRLFPAIEADEVVRLSGLSGRAACDLGDALQECLEGRVMYVGTVDSSANYRGLPAEARAVFDRLRSEGFLPVDQSTILVP